MSNPDLTEKKKFKESLNLPHTDFPIRPNPKVDDAAILEYWKKENLYGKAFTHNENKEKFILHDGPPYANGHIHLGSAYNKILKDIITKSQRMMGKHVPVTPGWDCHGLPIELKVVKELPNLSAELIKKECRLYATKWIEVQKDEFKKLGVVMDWDHPYLTMDYKYEAAIVRSFGIFLKEGYIEKKNKTVPWCMHDKTVLASAEIEYKERKDPSLYVRFRLEPNNVKQLLPTCTNKPVSVLVWTTTPWTLPLNRAVLIRPNTRYDVLDFDTEYCIVASELSENICSLKGVEKKVATQIMAEVLSTGKVLHPFIDNFTVPLLMDHSVSVQDGTAAVHCAPGCGPIDYEVALKNGLEIFSPISPDGKYTKGIDPLELEGMSVIDGQIWVIKKVAENGTLFFKNTVRHSYPHCWRCREGLIFRATNQWFCNLTHDSVREKAVKSLENITFLPERSIGFLKATIENRLEWCLSRQRIWGVPIPALICSSCDFVYTSPELIERVAQGVDKEGIEFWDTVAIEDLGIENEQCKQCYARSFIKEKDILDVWFDSGISHYAVLHTNPALHYPADIYCEGIDQHRGWFQSSLLTSLIIEKSPCMKSILTHGFTVDEHGQKMSKSLGNVVRPQEIIDRMGTDGLRLWASSIDYGGDIVVSETVLKNIAHVLQKIRNTCRFLLANIYDFDFDKDALPLEDVRMLDGYALEKLYELNARIQYHYITKNFTAIFHELNDYCTVNLSSLYLDIIKDRLYADKADGKKRRSAQTVCWIILDVLTKLMAPILSFTSEQLSDHYQKNKSESIHLQNFSSTDSIFSSLKVRQDAEIRKKQWDILLKIRSAILKAIEVQREQGIIKHSLEARLSLYINLPLEEMKLLHLFVADLEEHGELFAEFLKEFLIVSQVVIFNNPSGLQESELKGLFVVVERAHGTKCPRCWQWEITENADGLCKRCQEII